MTKNTFIDELVNKEIKKQLSQREQFLKKSIEDNCYYWQKKYIKLAIRFGWNIWFIKNITTNVPHELNSALVGFNFGSKSKYGCEINGKQYWMP